MSSSDDRKVRYALGLFTRVGDLERALQELGAARLPLAQVKVIAPPQGADGARGVWSSSGAALGFDTWIAAEAGGGGPWQFISADPDRAADGSGARAEVLPGFHIWALERHARQLDRHLRSGGGIVVVQFKSEAEERTACTTLLRHATAGVQTHEIGRQSPG
ncbi:MAG: hypothetical protein KJZ80_19635 [Hyphomicrobiaceae bacterium]|nr:hypothetical protein [Hyphomicrobiaceae bacterium]